MEEEEKMDTEVEDISKLFFSHLRMGTRLAN